MASEYEYQPVVHYEGIDGWFPIQTETNKGRTYLSLSSAKRVVTWHRGYARSANRPTTTYKIRRRLLGPWEDIPTDD